VPDTFFADAAIVVAAALVFLTTVLAAERGRRD